MSQESVHGGTRVIHRVRYSRQIRHLGEGIGFGHGTTLWGLPRRGRFAPGASRRSARRHGRVCMGTASPIPVPVPERWERSECEASLASLPEPEALGTTRDASERATDVYSRRLVGRHLPW
ncbi:hypothetical protein Acsp03_57260 [Actinomadura sp. NBRC 104412]|nr:hypothetical protein Acsp03_57260 [Actinomadura sp. NBRC 104412]